MLLNPAGGTVNAESRHCRDQCERYPTFPKKSLGLQNGLYWIGDSERAEFGKSLFQLAAVVVG